MDPANEAVENPSAELRNLFERYGGDGSTGDAIHETLAEAILSRTLPAGWRLGEERLAKLFSVSRTPVREALMRLESERLVSRSRRAGLVVAPISADQILEVYVIREALDGLAARQAAHHRSPGDIAILERLNEEMAVAADAGEFVRMARLNVDFHKALAHASRNVLLEQLVDQVHQAVRRFHRTTFAEEGRARLAVDEHVTMIEALRAGDEDGAEREARRHMRHALEVRVRMETGTG